VSFKKGFSSFCQHGFYCLSNRWHYNKITKNLETHFWHDLYIYSSTVESSTGLPFLHFLLTSLYLFRGRVSKHVCQLAMLSLNSAHLHIVPDRTV